MVVAAVAPGAPYEQLPQYEERRRRLSMADSKFWGGRLQLPSNASRDHVPKRWTLIHVPKTAGESLMVDSTRHMPIGTLLKGNDEHSLNRTNQTYPMVFFLRQPTSHVLSQFLECKYDSWGKSVTRKYEDFPGRGKLKSALAGFDEWIEHFVNITKHGLHWTRNISFGCYDPFNMQSRYLTADVSLAGKAGTHFAKSLEHRIPPIDQAKSVLASKIEFVGIVEHYAASLCLFEYHALGGHIVSPDCRVCDSSAHPPKVALASNGKLVRRTHGVPPHSTKLISNKTKALIEGEMTIVDQELYEFGLELFMRDVDAVRKATGIDLLCRILGDDDHKATTLPSAVVYGNTTASSPMFSHATNLAPDGNSSSQGRLLKPPQPLEYQVFTTLSGIVLFFCLASSRRTKRRIVAYINGE